MKSEKRIWIIFAICSIIAILFIEYQPNQQNPSVEDVPECEALMPQKASLELEEVWPTGIQLDFSEKDTIAYGKYGFRKTLEIKEKSIFEQEIPIDFWEKNLYFGIYADSKLAKPIERVSVGEQIRIYTALEMGAPLGEYEDRPGYISIVLEPGTYYLAAYTTDEKDSGIAIYQSRIAVVETEFTLEEGEWKYFYDTGKQQKTYFAIDVEKTGTLEIKCEENLFDYDVVLCDKEKNPIRKAVIQPKKKGKPQKAEVEVAQAGKYYLEVSTVGEEPSCFALGIHYIIR